MQILFIVKKRSSLGYYSGNVGLFHSANSVSTILNQNGYKSLVVEAVDANYINYFVSLHKPKIVILEAIWVTPDKLAQLAKLHKRVTWIVRLHSKIPFLSNEGIAFEWLLGYEKLRNSGYNVRIAGNHVEFNKSVESIIYKPLYLPNVYNHPYPYDKPIKYCKNHKVIHVGCFGAVRPMKNHVIQALAAINTAEYLGKKCIFHINGTRLEQNGENIKKNLVALFNGTNHILYQHNWHSHKDFFQKVIPTIDIGLQVSLSESFNIVTADFVYNNIPIVVSPEIEWMPFWTKADPNLVQDIQNRMISLLDGVLLTRLNKLWLKWHNKQAIQEWYNVLNFCY